MRDLNYQLKQLCKNWRDGSYATQWDRQRILTLIANELHEIGYRHMRAKSLRPKHVEALVSHWQAKDLSIGTIKNRMSALRWWAEKIDKQSIIARSNKHIWSAPVCKSLFVLAGVRLQSYIRPLFEGCHALRP